MNKLRILPLLAFFLTTAIFYQVDFPLAHHKDSRDTFTLSPFINYERVWADEDKNESYTQWFKDEMKISPKYVDKQEGVFGMSWSHFLSMLFLVIFFVGVIIAVYLRNRRTKEILHSLLREEEHEPEG